MLAVVCPSSALTPLLHTHHPAMSLQHFGKATLRVAKNYTKGYSDVQTKVRDATSNDPWGPTGQQMNEIAQMTYNQCVSSILNFLLVMLDY